MLIVLPPSETKAIGGKEPAIALDSLSFASLTPQRRALIDTLEHLGEDPAQALATLRLSEQMMPEVVLNAELSRSPTCPAILRYAGVLYNALQPASLPSEALTRLAVGSALFGVIMAGDLIPHYRLSGGVKLDLGSGPQTLKSVWGNSITEVLVNWQTEAEDNLVVDLRSGVYQSLGKLKEAVTVRVEGVRPDGSRKVVSHFSKHFKGELARVLALAKTDLNVEAGAEGVAAIARSAGMKMEVTSPYSLTMVV